MDKTKDITLPSGAKLKITVSSFPVAKALYKAVLEESKDLTFDPKAVVDVNLRKDLICMALSSEKIEAALKECMKRVTYNDKMVSDETWEPLEARDDYFLTCWHVGKENLYPFLKSLSLKFGSLFQALQSDQT